RELQQTRPRRLAWCGVRLQVFPEHVGPERGAIDAHTAELEAAARAEIVVGLEFVGQVRGLLRLTRRQRPRPDDVVLLLDLALLQEHADQKLLELTGELLCFRRSAAAPDEHLPVLQERVEHGTLPEKRQPALEQLVIELLLVE